MSIIDQKEQWWKEGAQAPEENVFSTIENLQSFTNERNTRFTRWLSLYHNATVEDFSEDNAFLFNRSSWRNGAPDQKRNALNPIESSISTLSSRIASVKINPKILTNTDSPDKWHLRQQAKKLQQFIIGEFRRGGVYENAEKVFVDAGIMGLGAFKIFAADGQIQYERVFPGEFLVDEAACMTSGQPRTLYQIKWIPAEILKARFPKYKQQIDAATGQASIIDAVSGTKIQSDLVEVAEGWHLKSGKDVNDGKHIMAINNCSLLLEDWTSRRFPFAFFRWSPVILGWWPQGLAEKGEVLQGEVNKLMGRIQDAHHLYSQTQTFVAQGTKINKNHLTNIPGAIVEYSGNIPPKVVMPNAVSSEVYSWVDKLYARVIEGFGLNEMSMSGSKPAGIESGVALRELQDSQSGRFAQLSKSWEQMFVDIAEITIELAAELDSEQEGGYKSRLVESGGIKDIKWSDINLERDSYEIQVWPASMLPQTPAGKLAAVQDLMKNQFMDKATALSMITDIPDLESFTSLENAAYDDAQKQIETMIIDGEQVHPEPYQNLELCLKMTTSALLRAKLDGVPEEKLDLLQNYLDEIQDLLMPPEAPMGMPPEGAQMPPEAPTGQMELPLPQGGEMPAGGPAGPPMNM